MSISSNKEYVQASAIEGLLVLTGKRVGAFQTLALILFMFFFSFFLWDVLAVLYQHTYFSDRKDNMGIGTRHPRVREMIAQ